MYFLFKRGVYGHGIFWFGDNLEEGKRETDKAASMDKDDYHEWNLYEYLKPKNKDYKEDHQHKKVYTGVRT